jgi:hypothetical protein
LNGLVESQFVLVFSDIEYDDKSVCGDAGHVAARYNGSSPEVWANRVRQGFARLLHFGPQVLGGYTVNMLLRRGLARMDQNSELVPDELALAAWCAWIEDRNRKSLQSESHKKTYMRFEFI